MIAPTLPLFPCVPETDLERAAEDFVAANPHVWDRFVSLTFRLIEKGRDRAGVALIFERMRWDWFIRTVGDEFKLNNNHRAWFARRFHAKFPEHGRFFETRGRRA